MGNRLLSAELIPYRGSWILIEEDEKESKLNAKERALKAAGAPDANNDPDEYNLIYIVVDKSHKISLSVFLRCLGLVTDEDIINMFGDEECLRMTLEKDETRNASDPQTAAFQEFFKKVRNNEPFTVDNAKNILNKTYFDSLRYDLERVGIYKVNKKFELSARIIGSKTADNVVTEDGELICKKNTVITDEIAAKIEFRSSPESSFAQQMRMSSKMYLSRSSATAELTLRLSSQTALQRLSSRSSISQEQALTRRLEQAS